MAELETTEVVDATDKELFSGATAAEPPKPVEVAPEIPRDEAGRFAPKEPVQDTKPETTPVVTEKPPAEPEGGSGIPAWRLKEEAESKREWKERAEKAEAERQKFERQFYETQQRLSQFEKPAPVEEVPDPLLDPQGYRQFFDRQLNERLLNQQREFDMRLAQRTHGEVFNKAYQEAQSEIGRGDRSLMAMMQNASSPGEALVQWYKQKQTMQEVGGDPSAWLQKQLEQKMHDPAFQAQVIELARSKASAAPGSRPIVDLPPSLSGASSAGASTLDPDDGDTSDAAVFRQAFRR